MQGKLFGFIADLEVPYFACFRMPMSTSVILTYPVPPFTTIIGMIANALGISRPDYFKGISWLQRVLWLNLRYIMPFQRPSYELAKVLKMKKEEGRERPVRARFPSSPMYKYFLVKPSYRLFVACENYEVAERIIEALNYPKRPLYLGQSDDMVVVTVVWSGEVEQVKSQEAYGLLQGLYEGERQQVEVLRLPIGFEDKDRVIFSPLLSLPSQFPFKLPEPEPLWCFSGETVHLFNADEVLRNVDR